MAFADRFETPRCKLVRATKSDLDAVTRVFDDNDEFLTSTGVQLRPRELAEDTVFNRTLPPNGQTKRAFTYGICTKTDKSLVGVLEFYVGYPDETCLWIAKLYLRKAAQGMQYGRGVVSEVEATAKRNGMLEIRIAINVPNWGALWFWSRVGYTDICGVHGPSSPPEGMVVLSKRL